jgi:hypothetical protein
MKFEGKKHGWIINPDAIKLSNNTLIMSRSFSLVRGFCLLTLTLAPVLSLRGANPIPEDCKVGGVAIGTIVYTFDHFTLFEALEKTAQAGAKVVELSAKTSLSKEEPNVPFDYHASPETIDKVKTKLAQCHLKPVNYAIIPFPDGEPEARKLFEFAKRGSPHGASDPYLLCFVR